MAEKSPLIVALDFAVRSELDSLVAKLDPSLCRLKVGKELFTLFGPDVVRDLQRRGFEVFLDLKFHDIPNTTALAPFGKDAPLLIAVTVLTSMQSNELGSIGVNDDAVSQVGRLAKLTADSGLDGVVCSAQEVSILRGQIPDDFLLVTPGIRPEGSALGDQQRVATPSEAISMGSDYLVIGRPITRSADPLAMLKQINASLGY